MTSASSPIDYCTCGAFSGSHCRIAYCDRRYPLHTQQEARKSAIQAALDCRYGIIDKQTYDIVQRRLHLRIKDLDGAAK